MAQAKKKPAAKAAQAPEKEAVKTAAAQEKTVGKKKILFVASEALPFVKTGGIAACSRRLTRA